VGEAGRERADGVHPLRVHELVAQRLALLLEAEALLELALEERGGGGLLALAQDRLVHRAPHRSADEPRRHGQPDHRPDVEDQRGIVDERELEREPHAERAQRRRDEHALAEQHDARQRHLDDEREDEVRLAGGRQRRQRRDRREQPQRGRREVRVAIRNAVAPQEEEHRHRDREDHGVDADDRQRERDAARDAEDEAARDADELDREPEPHAIEDRLDDPRLYVRYLGATGGHSTRIHRPFRPMTAVLLGYWWVSRPHLTHSSGGAAAGGV
jgi:hypothetical protein